jgi:hypothetical protein
VRIFVSVKKRIVSSVVGASLVLTGIGITVGVMTSGSSTPPTSPSGPSLSGPSKLPVPSHMSTPVQGPLPPAPDATSSSQAAAGIYGYLQTPFSSSVFTEQNGYMGDAGSQWVEVFAGQALAPSGKDNGPVLIVYTWPSESALGNGSPGTDTGQFSVPGASTGWAEISAVSGSILSVVTEGGQRATFNLASDKYSSES